MKWRFLSLPLVLGLAVLVAEADNGKKGASSIADLIKRRPVDEFNDQVKDKQKGDDKPTRGGSLRIRIPIEPKSLSPILENGAQARTISGYLYYYLIDRDTETFEWLPYIAKSWDTRDVMLLKPEKEGAEPKRVIGLAIKEDKTSVSFSEGARILTIGKHDLKSFDIKKGVIVTKDLVFDKAANRSWTGHATVEGETIKLAVDMAWEKKAEKVFKKADVQFVPSQTIKGQIREGVTGRKDSYTLHITVMGKAPQTYSFDKLMEDEEKVGKRVKKKPALRRRVLYDFHMRRGVQWDNGTGLSADDVLFTVSTIKNDTVDCEFLRNYYKDLISWTKVGESSVRLEYGKQYFRALTFLGNIYIMPKHRFNVDKFKGDPENFGRYFNKHPDKLAPVGNGPYRFSKWDKNSREIKIVRNDKFFGRTAGLPYWDPARPYLDSITWVVINKAAPALKELIKESVDADFDIEPLTWRGLDTQSDDFKSKFVRAQFLQPLYTYIGWNQNRPGVPEKRQFFKDIRVRRAMTMLIPRELILKEIHGSLGEKVNGPFYRYGPFHNGNVQAIKYSPERAKVLLDEAGWVDSDNDGIRDKDGVKFEFEYLIHNARVYHQQIADKIKESVEQAGVRMNIRKIDWRVFGETVRDRKFDAVRFAWGEPSCIETDPYQIWHSSQSANRGSNYVSFKNPKADRIIEKVRLTLDFAKRQRYLKRFHQIVADEQPYTFLYNFYSLYFYSKRYRGVKFYIIGTDPYDLTEWYVPKGQQRSK